MRYSENYVFTAKATSADDLQKIETLRQTVKTINHMQRQYEKATGQQQTRYRVCLRGRLGKNNSNAWKYQMRQKAYVGYGARPYQMIRLSDAAYFDVYVYER
jgi:hypothetical protein